ncbi:hypothetical protein B0J13DRAFT_600910 [Dactylonectria estremocensis]|uniref:Uncharacterized protein n=1 Tax=Dactylonectria estremocensis TaxID=1079267 RepID=A0A9P9FI64_9HYPO|nr:hypothetical protein B0J13DRAFT_600910 [Dactylonectria estremocensis]
MIRLGSSVSIAIDFGQGHTNCVQLSAVKWHSLQSRSHMVQTKEKPPGQQGLLWINQYEAKIHPSAWVPEIHWPVVTFAKAHLVMNQHLHGERYGLSLDSLEYNFVFESKDYWHAPELNLFEDGDKSSIKGLRSCNACLTGYSIAILGDELTGWNLELGTSARLSCGCPLFASALLYGRYCCLVGQQGTAELQYDTAPKVFQDGLASLPAQQGKKMAGGMSRRLSRVESLDPGGCRSGRHADPRPSQQLGVATVPSPSLSTNLMMLLFTRSVAAAVILLGTAVAADAYVPVHKRFSYNAAVNDFSYLSMLSKRDECSDAFGDNAHNSNCAPDFTLCCTRDGLSYPSCEKWLNKGWCCVGDGETDKCYVDQQSVCNEDSSVSCTILANSADKACCPKLTTCEETVPASEAYVRCNINRSDLLVAHAAANGESSTSSEASSASTQASTSTTSDVSRTTDPEVQTSSATSAPDDKSTTPAGGVIGGIVVAAVAAIAGIAGLAFWFYQRSKKTKYEAANQSPPHPSIAHHYQDQQLKYQQQQQQQQQQQGYCPTGPPHQYNGYMYQQQQQHQPPAELMDQRPPVELDSSMQYSSM